MAGDLEFQRCFSDGRVDANTSLDLLRMLLETMQVYSSTHFKHFAS